MVKNFIRGYFPTAATKVAYSHLMGWGMENTAAELDRHIKDMHLKGYRHVDNKFDERWTTPLLKFQGVDGWFCVEKEGEV